MRKLIVGVMVVLALLAAAPVRAQGGPPLITDDPDTPGPRHWEINLAAILSKYHDGQSMDLPRIDANYGVGRRVQLKFEAPWVQAREGGETASGAGNAVAGVKYRFVGQEGRLIAWSVYPQVEFGAPRGSVAKGIADGGASLFLPTELTIEKHVEVNVEAGRRFVSNGGDGWDYGVSTEGHVVPRLELLGEVHVDAPAGSPREVIVNLGARPTVTQRIVLLLAVGRAVHGDETRPRLLLYSGLQLNLPGRFAFDTAAPRTPAAGR